MAQPESWGMKAWYCECENYYEATHRPAQLFQTEPAKDQCHRLDACGWHIVTLVKVEETNA